MRQILTLTKKELRLLLRDSRAAILLLGMPLLFVFILGLLLGEGFGQNPDKRLRVSIVDLDQEYIESESAVREGLACFAAGLAPGTFRMFGEPALTVLSAVTAHRQNRFPGETWSQVVLRDLDQTAGIRVEMVRSREEAEYLCNTGRRAAILVFGPRFSDQVTHSSFMADGINPFYRDGVNLNILDVTLLKDETQVTTAAVIEQVAQVTLLRVIFPYMIGKAFERLGDEAFIQRLGTEVVVHRVPLNKILRTSKERLQVGAGVQRALKAQYPKYDLTAKTWAAMTRAEPLPRTGLSCSLYQNEDGTGLLHRGATRYQILVPAYTVMFAFALILVVGWLFVTERRQGTLKRLRAAPLLRSQVLLGKLLPCLLLAFAQGWFLLIGGKLLFGLRWGPDHWSLAQQILWLAPVVITTATAAMGLALLVAALARTEMQVAIYGSLLVLALGLLSGCVVPREMMPEHTQQLSLLTPHGWALAAYSQLFLKSEPSLEVIGFACMVLGLFGTGFLGLAWAVMRLD